MIQIENISVMNIENAIRGARNPLDSWNQSDSYNENGKYIIGEKDKKLAHKLILAGNDHAKFLRQIFISMDITAPLYWWKEMDTYKVSTTANSCSTMHTIHKKPFTKEMFSIDNQDDVFVEMTINHLEDLRQKYLATKDKKYWRHLIQLLPSSFNQMRTWTGSFQNVRNMYFSRNSHKLIEWQMFCNILETLPYSDLIIITKENIKYE